MKLEYFIQLEADRCVKCGLCLPHCPTYGKTQDEGDSPRGRIALMQALASGQFKDSTRLPFHLDRCLGCRACEQACPSGVAYGQLIDTSRALLARKTPEAVAVTPADRLLAALLNKRQSLRYASKLLRLYHYSGLQWLARRSGLLRKSGLQRLDAYLPKAERMTAWRRHYPPTVTERGRIALFTGCVGNLFDQTTLRATIRLLTQSGYRVYIPDGQVCCGALPLHQGALERAAELAASNLQAFNRLDVDALVYTASGCGATLGEYPDLARLTDARPGAQAAFKFPVMDINQFLATQDWPAGMRLAPLNKTAAVHEPCAMNHVLNNQQYPYHLLERIPGLQTTPLPDNPQCCGAAGNYMFTQPTMADALRDDKIAHLKHLQPDLLLTSNIGCALHLAAGIRATGLSIEVIHPVTLVARQLQE